MIRVSVLLALGAAMAVVACGGNDNDKSPATATATGSATRAATAPTTAATVAAVALSSTLDLSAAPVSLPITIKVPSGATAKSASTGAEVRAGTGFQLDIGRSKGDVAATKKEVQANKVNQFKRFVVDEPTGIVYESAVGGKSEYHAYVAAAAGTGYRCEDIKGPVYTEAQAKTIYDACKSIAAK